jgi:YfiH family protein
VRKVACVAHAGWRGVLGGLPEKIIATMTAEYQSETKDIHAAIGPHICTSCYEVGGELAEKFEEKFSDGVIMNKGSKIYLDLEAAILKQFMDADILPTNVTCADLCTYCHPELFYSHRRDHGKTGAMASLIAFEKAGENK